ncbi:MAG: helix-turn-helix domain-containing protein [Methanocellales archaeon]
MDDFNVIVTYLIRCCELSEEEAQLFYGLNKFGPTNASKLAKEYGLPRMKVYRILKKMKEKNLVKFLQERPFKFAAIPIQEAISAMIASKKEKIARIQKIREELKDFLKFDISLNRSIAKFNIIQGRPQILSTAAKMHLKAKKEICIIAPKNALVRNIAKGIDDILENCKKVGLKIRVLTNIDRENLESVKRFLQFSEMRHFPLNEMGELIIIDNNEILAVISPSPSPSLNVKDETAIWTNAACYANFQKSIFDELWKDALDGEKRIMQVENQPYNPSSPAS